MMNLPHSRFLSAIGLLSIGALLAILFMSLDDEPAVADRTKGTSAFDQLYEKHRHQLERQSVMVSPPLPPALNFAGEPVPTQDRIVYEDLEKHLVMNMYNYAATMLAIKRASRWEQEMKAILKKEGVPEDFFYLMLAESHAENATSWAGAKGYWQFMKDTGREYGLRINEEVDERLNPIKSTHAACAYLKKSHRMFGNWSLVAASYNQGMGATRYYLKKQQAKGYYDMYLNPETAQYLYRIIALKTILQSPELYGFQVTAEYLYPEIPYKTVQADTAINDLVQFAKDQGTNYKLLRRQNPWILDYSLEKPDADEPYAFRISTPADFEQRR